MFRSLIHMEFIFVYSVRNRDLVLFSPYLENQWYPNDQFLSTLIYNAIFFLCPIPMYAWIIFIFSLYASVTEVYLVLLFPFMCLVLEVC